MTVHYVQNAASNFQRSFMCSMYSRCKAVLAINFTAANSIVNFKCLLLNTAECCWMGMHCMDGDKFTFFDNR